MQRPLIVAAAGLLVLVVLGIVAGTWWYERPTRLTVAIAKGDHDDYALMSAATSVLKFGRTAVRLQLQPVENAAAAAAAVDDGQADLAVIRSDVALPKSAQTMVILHRDAALLIAPAGNRIRKITDLAKRTLGIVRRGPGNDRIIATALAQYDVAPDSVKLVALGPENVSEALRTKQVDAILVVDVVSSARLREIVKAVTSAGRGAPFFIPIAEATAIAQRSPAYEKLEVVRGAFGGLPPRPAEEFDTLSITYRLVANENVSPTAVGGLTRFLLTEKLQMAATAPMAQQIEPPSTDKDAPLPVHAGSAAYIDDDEQTFFDKYSDMIYIGAMLLGVLASAATAIMGRLNNRRAVSLDGSVARILEMLGLVRSAPTLEELDALQHEADALLASAVNTASANSTGDDRRLSAFGLTLDQLRSAIRDRRADLAGQRGAATAPTLVRTAAE